MGYLTNYSLTTTAGCDTDIIEWLQAKGIIEYALTYELESYDSTTWYNHVKDMQELSTAFPTVVFTLHGEGEESGDIWEKHFLNGKMQVCKATVIIPPYNPEQLR